MKPNIAFTPTSFNISEFKEVHNLLREFELFDIDLRVQPLMLMGRAAKNLENINPTQLQYRKLVKEINYFNDNNIKPYIQWGDRIHQCIIRANGDIVCSSYLPLVVGNIRKHSLLDYWNSGLAEAWSYNIPKKIAQSIKSIEDMKNPDENLPILWKEEDIFIDLIEEDLNDLSLINIK